MKFAIVGLLCSLALGLYAHVIDSNTELPLVESDTDAEYHEHQILGFTVHMSAEDTDDHPEKAEDMLWYVRAQLQKMIEVLPLSKIKLLRTVDIWVNDDYDEDDETCGLACYVQEGYTGVSFYEDRDGSVIIRDFEEPIKDAWCCTHGLILHEMAHALHDQFIKDGWSNSNINTAYTVSKATKDYEDNQVLYPWWSNQLRDHYGMTNAREYFATMTETFFLWYKVYPHNVRDLYSHDDSAYYTIYNFWYSAVVDNEIDPYANNVSETQPNLPQEPL